LISEATRNWKQVDQRPLLARYFEHGKMKSASDRQRGECNRFLNSNPRPGPELDCVRRLHFVADTFFQAQENRHKADYDSATQWTRTETVALIADVDLAFQNWRAIRESALARLSDFSFGKSEGRLEPITFRPAHEMSLSPGDRLDGGNADVIPFVDRGKIRHGPARR
jgi:hypothetical protein